MTRIILIILTVFSLTGIVSAKDYEQPVALKQSSSNTEVCSYQYADSLTNGEFFNHLVTASYDCVAYLFGTTGYENTYSSNRLNSVVNLTSDYLVNYDDDGSLRNVFVYFQAAGYVQGFTDYSIPSGDLVAINSVLHEYSDSDLFDSDSPNNGEVLKTWIYATSNLDQFSDFFDDIKRVLGSYDQSRRDVINHQMAITAAYTFIFRSHFNDETFVTNTLSTDTELPLLLKDIILDDGSPRDSSIVVDGVRELTRLLRFESHPTIVDVVNDILPTFSRFDDLWLLTATSVYTYGVDCTQFVADMCVDNFRQELEEYALPNVFEFENGIKIKTGVDRNTAIELYLEMKTAEASFFNITNQVVPIADDINDQMTLWLYKSEIHYQTINVLLFNLPTNNGGIYIERDSALYTFDRDNSMFSTNELVRHEYVHYLTSRYIIPGFFGETELWSNNRLTWFDEGLANFISGVDHDMSVIPLTTMTVLVDQTTVLEPSEIVTMKYGDAGLYPLSSLLMNVTFENNNQLMFDAYQAIKSNDSFLTDLSFEAIGSYTSKVELENYIDNIPSTLDVPSIVINERELQSSDSNDIEIMLGNGFQCSEFADGQFANCITTVPTQSNDIDQSTSISQFVSSLFANPIYNNIDTMSCGQSAIENTDTTVDCVVMLRRDSVEYDSGVIPEYNDVHVNVNEGSYTNRLLIDINEQNTNSDVDTNGDTITYSLITETSLFTVDSSTGELNVQGILDYETTSQHILEITAETEYASVTIPVVVVVNDVFENNPPTISDVTVNVDENMSNRMIVDLNDSNTGTDVDIDGDELSYTIASGNNGNFTINSSNGQITLTSSFDYETVRQQQLVVQVTDGYDTIDVVVTINVNDVNESTPSPNQPTTKSGGGSSSWLLLLLLLGVVTIRRVRS